MGTNASVLQWFCRDCDNINPTEQTHCIKCGKERVSADISELQEVNKGKVQSRRLSQEDDAAMR